MYALYLGADITHTHTHTHTHITLFFPISSPHAVPSLSSRYGKDSGSSIPCRLVEDASDCRLIDGEGEADIYPGNRRDDTSHGGAFEDWSYTTSLCKGSYTIEHTGYVFI